MAAVSAGREGHSVIEQIEMLREEWEYDLCVSDVAEFKQRYIFQFDPARAAGIPSRRK